MSFYTSISILAILVSYHYFTEFLAVYIIGIYNAADEGMILYKLSEVLKKIVGTWLHKPILGCPYCMPSLHVGLPITFITVCAAIGLSSYWTLVFGLLFAFITTVVTSGKVVSKFSEISRNWEEDQYYTNKNEELEQANTLLRSTIEEDIVNA